MCSKGSNQYSGGRPEGAFTPRKGIQIPEPRNTLLVESRNWDKSAILVFGIRNTAQGIHSTIKDGNLESKFHLQRLESSTWNPDFTAWNPEFVLGSLILGKYSCVIIQIN